MSYGQRFEFREATKPITTKARELDRQRKAILGADAEAVAAIDKSLESDKRLEEMRRILGDERYYQIVDNLEEDAACAAELDRAMMRWAFVKAELSGADLMNFSSFDAFANWLSEADSITVIDAVRREVGLLPQEQGNSASPSISAAPVDGATKPTTALSAS